MRDDHVRVGIAGQVLLKPVAGFEIEVVGGLVEQQQVRPLEQELGKREAHLPAAGKFFSLTLPVVAVKAESAKNRADLGFERVAVAGHEFVFQLLVAVGDVGVFLALVVEFGHAAGERLHFFFDGVEFVKHRHAFGKDGAAGHG